MPSQEPTPLPPAIEARLCAHCNGKGYLSLRNRMHRETCEFCRGRGHSPTDRLSPELDAVLYPLRYPDAAARSTPRPPSR